MSTILRSLAIVFLLAFGVASGAQAQLTATVYSSGLSAPVAFVQDPTDRTVQFVVEQQGRIRVVRSGVLLVTPFLDIQSSVAFGGEQGLLGLALAPDYSASGRFFVNFTDRAGNTVVARFRRSANPVIADSASRFDLRWGGPSGPPFIAQPFANHNGGNLVFGPDGFLYIGMGDGGSGDDPGHRAQNPQELLGKMLRIDVNVPDGHPSGYQVPSDNPFVGGGPVAALPEIWSIGMRNPWRWGFDDSARGGTGALIIGDVGQNAWEEIDYEPRNRGGRNYGWPYREGTHDHVTSFPPAFFPLRNPVHEYDHSNGSAVTGGLVYRGLSLASRGRYFFADFGAGRVWSIAFTIDPATGEAQASNLLEHTAELGGSAFLGNISSFGTDANGELYLVGYLGRIFKIAIGGPRLPTDFDADLKMDPTVFRASTGSWFALKSSGNYSSYLGVSWGLSTDKPVPGDYDGDGRIDPAVYRPSTGGWFVLQSSTNFTTSTAAFLGTSTDIPAPGDFDGDGRTDPAVFRPSTGEWLILPSSGPSIPPLVLGLGTDLLVAGDYDGDGKTDPAVYRPSTGEWIYLKSSGNFLTSQSFSWGLATDVPVPGDYDGDGRTDPAVYRPSTGGWFNLQSSTNYTSSGAHFWGLNTDTPVPGDYDGDGRFDPAVWRSSTGTWYVLRSSANYTTSFGLSWGLSTDMPINRRP